MTDATFQMLLIILGGVLAISGLMALAIQASNRTTLKNVQEELHELANKVSDMKVDIAKNYVTYHSHTQIHRGFGSGGGGD